MIVQPVLETERGICVKEKSGEGDKARTYIGSVLLLVVIIIVFLLVVVGVLHVVVLGGEGLALALVVGGIRHRLGACAAGGVLNAVAVARHCK